MVVRNGAHHCNKRIRVAFRYDDLSSSSSTEFEVELFQIFQKHKIPITVGIIPFICNGNAEDPSPQGAIPLTLEKAALLKPIMQAGLLEAAMHGYSHQTILTRAQGGFTEFASLDYNKQLEKIIAGKQVVEDRLGTKITTFIPPWNSCDKNTTRALADAGFTCVSAGRTSIRWQVPRLGFLPSTCTLFDVEDAVTSARDFVDSLPVIIVLLHSFDFTVDRAERKFTFQDLDNLLSWITLQEDIMVHTIAQVHQILKELDEIDKRSQFAALKDRVRLLFAKKRLPFYPGKISLRLIASKLISR